MIGIPLFFLELAVGQRIRRGSIGVWNYISPRLGGIGFASCVVSLGAILSPCNLKLFGNDRLCSLFLLVLQVCFFVALYYNVIISWSLFYFSQSFQNPLPWQECPLMKNKTPTRECSRTHRYTATVGVDGREPLLSLAVAFTDVVPECEKSSATTYYWYRKTLDISDSISESGGVNWKMTLSLLASWILVCLAMIKGIKSSGKVVFVPTAFAQQKWTFARS